MPVSRFTQPIVSCVCTFACLLRILLSAVRRQCAAALGYGPLLAVLAGSLLPLQPAAAQFLGGSAVASSDAQIDALRRTPIRIIALDQEGGNIARGRIRIEQIRHAFPLGLVVPPTGWPGEREGDRETQEPWDAFNALSLERHSRWALLQPDPDQPPDWSRLDELVVLARERGYAIRFGGVLSADAARNPDWTVPLRGAAVREALENWTRMVLQRFGPHLTAVDLYTHVLEGDLLRERLGGGMTRRLYDQARAAEPQLRLGMRFEEVMDLVGSRPMVAASRAAQQDFLQLDELVITGSVQQRLTPESLNRILQRSLQTRLPVVVGALSVGGESTIDAAAGLESVLRYLFATAAVSGIYLDETLPGEARNPFAALVDEQGEPTPSGRVVRRLFREEWWTQFEGQADELGNCHTRVFAGVHRIHVQPPRGAGYSQTVYLPWTSEERIIVVQPPMD